MRGAHRRLAGALVLIGVAACSQPPTTPTTDLPPTLLGPPFTPGIYWFSIVCDGVIPHGVPMPVWVRVELRGEGGARTVESSAPGDSLRLDLRITGPARVNDYAVVGELTGRAANVPIGVPGFQVGRLVVDPRTALEGIARPGGIGFADGTFDGRVTIEGASGAAKVCLSGGWTLQPASS